MKINWNGFAWERERIKWMLVGGLWWNEVAFTGSAHAFSEKKFVCEGGFFGWMRGWKKNEWELFCTRRAEMMIEYKGCNH